MGFKWPPWWRVELRCSLQSWRGLVVVVTTYFQLIDLVFPTVLLSNYPLPMELQRQQSKLAL